MYISHIRYCTYVWWLLIAGIKEQCHFCWETSYSRRNAFDCNYAAVRQWPMQGKVASLGVCNLSEQQHVLCNRQD